MNLSSTRRRTTSPSSLMTSSVTSSFFSLRRNEIRAVSRVPSPLGENNVSEVCDSARTGGVCDFSRWATTNAPTTAHSSTPNTT